MIPDVNGLRSGVEPRGPIRELGSRSGSGEERAELANQPTVFLICTEAYGRPGAQRPGSAWPRRKETRRSIQARSCPSHMLKRG